MYACLEISTRTQNLSYVQASRNDNPTAHRKKHSDTKLKLPPHTLHVERLRTYYNIHAFVDAFCMVA